MKPDLIKALAELAWPILAAIVLFALLPTLIQVARSRAVSIKYGDMEISIQDASDQLRRQVEDLQSQVQQLVAVGDRLGSRRAAGEQGVAVRDQPRIGTILWVDDNPRNNAHEIAKLQDDGWEITTVTTTFDALTKLDRVSERPAVIISDMSRREGILRRSTAGLDLIRQVRSRKLEIPIFIYASENAARAFQGEVRELGGNGITASPLDLFRLVEGIVTPPARSPS